MGSIESKSKSADISTNKPAEQQENGHVKANGDAPTKQNGDAVPSNGSAESPAEAAESGEAIESAPPANGDSKPEDPPGKQAKKKKRFSFKNLKFGNNPFRKTKKDQAPGEETPADEGATGSPQEPEIKDGAVEAAPEATPENGECETAAPSSDTIEEVQPEAAALPPTEDSPKPVESEASTEAPSEPQKQEE
ncbi:hypothetical protein XENTR_v10005930 [Xenopus tropicalis]|uniref:MARCKS-like 1 n=1 Tax=Xenopus tropicalis TaxID=8364 RepID=Q28I11_XENTR|nr:MARCKS-related protein [Xenopus tropicalis]AAI57760.1 MARCKS-like 1 [Xenopus tropicalis]KAE8624362.1 hypothetical protein XENTR_v10005930 [Xenopus tropicalis]CAJ81353.1 novel protein [Xenopus tropicalis]|eukprot:NP_001037902.1 MARCKS-related protein [Xenopus tropicalis]